jgi:hypothetical protein
MKSTIVQEICEIEAKSERDEKNDVRSKKNVNEDYPKNIENYYALLRAICESSTTMTQPCEKKSCESFKENIVGNRICSNNDTSNQQSRKNININIKNEADNLESDIIINSLDVSINGSYGNINKVRISCTTTPTKAIPVPSPNSNQQIVTSSSSSLCDENYCDTKAARASSTHGVVERKFEPIPDDIAATAALHDYRDSKQYTCNSRFTKYSSSEDDAIDYQTKSIGSHNKRNSTGDNIKPITSTYLLMTRSMGLTDEDALNLVSAFALVFIDVNFQQNTNVSNIQEINYILPLF